MTNKFKEDQRTEPTPINLLFILHPENMEHLLIEVKSWKIIFKD